MRLLRVPLEGPKETWVDFYSVTGKRCIAASSPLQVQDALTDLSDFMFATGYIV